MAALCELWKRRDRNIGQLDAPGDGLLFLPKNLTCIEFKKMEPWLPAFVIKYAINLTN